MVLCEYWKVKGLLEFILATTNEYNKENCIRSSLFKRFSKGQAYDFHL